MNTITVDGQVLVLTQVRTAKHENYLGRDNQDRQWYAATVCGHPVRDPRVGSCRDCHAPRPKSRKHANYIGPDVNGVTWWKALECGHPVRNPRTRNCEKCPRVRGRNLNPKYANCLGYGEDGHTKYLAPCGHPATAPDTQECWECRIAGATNYPRLGRENKHRIIAERVLGRPLKTNEIVHHINLDKRDFRNCNLLICDKQYHAYLHAAMERKYGEMCNPPIQRTA